MKTSLIWILLAGVTAAATALAETGEYYLVTRAGDITRMVISSDGVMINRLASVPGTVRLLEARFSMEDYLLVAADDGKLYETSCASPLPEFRRVYTDGDLTFSILHNPEDNRPVWFHDLPNQPERVEVRQIVGGQSVVVPKRSILFRSGTGNGYNLDGEKSTEDLTKEGLPRTLAERYPAGRWVLSGRSRVIAVYSKIVAQITSDGDRFKSSFLLLNRRTQSWTRIDLEEAGEIEVFDDVAVIQGINDIKGDLDPKTGNQILGVPSGSWHFYVPALQSTLSCQLDPSWVILHATGHRAFAAGNGRLFELQIGVDGVSDPRLKADLPKGTDPVALFPLDAEGPPGE